MAEGNSKKKLQKKDGKKKQKDQSQWSVDVLLEEFRKESDRASVILTCSILDGTLTTMLRAYLVPSPTSNDSLLSGYNAPLSVFSSKIDSCFRLGLISSRLCRDLHLIRKIRNKFAHDIRGCNFEESDVKSRILELEKSMNRLVSSRKDMEFEFDAKESFLHLASGILWALNTCVEEIKITKDRPPEFMYKF